MPPAVTKFVSVILTVVAVRVAAAVVPIPADEALEKVRASVEELTKTDYADLKSGRMTHSELAASLLDRSQNVTNSASVYLLRRAAFRQYVNGGDIASAGRLYDRMVRSGGVLYAQSLARFSARLLSRQADAKVVGAKELLDRLSAVEKKVRDEEEARQLAEKSPEDPVAVEKHAVALAVLDDWPAALTLFSRLPGHMREITLFERRYPRTGVTLLTTADVADHWWDYAETAALSASECVVFRQRAAKWYRLAAENGVLRGARKQVAEKRILEAGGTK